jgi:hypothetical protein
VCHRPLVAWEDVLAADGGAFEIVNRQAGTIWAVATLGRGASGGGALSFRGKYRASLAGPGRSCGATDGARTETLGVDGLWARLKGKGKRGVVMAPEYQPDSRCLSCRSTWKAFERSQMTRTSQYSLWMAPPIPSE